MAAAFSYTVSAELPIDGPEVTIDFVPVEYIYLNDYMQDFISPDMDIPAEADTTFNYANDPPFGMALGQCQSKPCAETEEPVWLDNETDFDLAGGWNFMATSDGAYQDNGRLHDEVYMWIYDTYCEFSLEVSGYACPE